jgi:hypothetical protein
MDYINTSHPSFIGGSKAVEIAQQQIKSSKVSLAMPRQKVCVLCKFSSVLLYLYLISDFVRPHISLVPILFTFLLIRMP